MRFVVALVCGLSLSGCEAPEIGKAKETIKGRLRDPASAVFTNIIERDGHVCGDVNSKNAFGGMAGATPFVVTREGKASVSPSVGDLTPQRLNEMREACYNGPGDGFSHACQSYRQSHAAAEALAKWTAERDKLCGAMPKP